ncbi:MAG: hypothetical protein WKG07_06245 [Hymenobacter sp.]
MTPQAGSSFAADLGAYYTKDATIGAGIYNLAFGASISNLGNKMSYIEHAEYQLPTHHATPGHGHHPRD